MDNLFNFDFPKLCKIRVWILFKKIRKQILFFTKIAQMKNFISSKNTFTILILWGLVLFLLAVIGYSVQQETVSLIPTMILLLVCAFIVWVLLDTRYVIRNNKLLYRSGPFRGGFDISKIRKIEYFSGYNIPTSIKPALDFKGFIIHYNRFDDVYVSPKNANVFLETLQKLNPKIEIVRS